jgi:hypothetical protein
MDADDLPIAFNDPTIRYTHVNFGGVWSFYKTARKVAISNIVFVIHEEPTDPIWTGLLRGLWMLGGGELLSSSDVNYFKRL